MFKVTVDDEEFEGVVGYSTPGGNLLLLDFEDGSTHGVSGFCNFTIQRIKEKND